MKERGGWSGGGVFVGDGLEVECEGGEEKKKDVAKATHHGGIYLRNDPKGIADDAVCDDWRGIMPMICGGCRGEQSVEGKPR